MPTTVSTFSSSEIALNWEELYVSEGINRDVASFVGPGIQRGFRLGTSGTNLNVAVTADSLTTDHAAAIRVADGHVLGIKRTGGTFNLDLTAYTNKTVVVAIYATYATSATTTGVIRAYQLSPSDEFTGAAERAILVVLGTVVVPGSGTIPAANISYGYRNEAWDGRNEQQVEPAQLIQNGSFEYSTAPGTGVHSAWFWELVAGAGGSASNWQTENADPAISGESRDLILKYDSGVGAVVSTYKQYLDARVSAGNILRLKLKVKVLHVTTGGSFQVVLHYLDATHSETISPTTTTITTSSTDASYRQIDVLITVPASSAFLYYIELKGNNITLASTNSVLRVDDVQLWVDTRSASTPRPPQNERARLLLAELFTLVAKDGLFGAPAGQLTLDNTVSSEPAIIVDRQDQTVNDDSNRPPLMKVLGRIEAGRGIHGGNRNVEAMATPWKLSAGGKVPYTLCWTSAPESGSHVVARLFVGTDGSVMFTSNAGLASDSTPTTWNRDVSADSYRLFATTSSATLGAHPRLEFRSSGASNGWLETDWTIIWDPYADVLQTEAFTTTGSCGDNVRLFTVDSTGGAFALTLPDPSANALKAFVFKDIGFMCATNNVALTPFGGERIEGLATAYSMDADGLNLTLWSDGTDWWIIG